MTTSSSSLFDRIIYAIPFLAKLQDWVIALGERKSATRWLYGLSFLESIIFPVPIDPLLAGIVMARPQDYIRLALLTGLASTLGGIAGWGIGVWLGDVVMTSGWIGKDSAYEAVAAGFAAHGWVLVLIGAFTPLPYKVMVVSGEICSCNSYRITSCRDSRGTPRVSKCGTISRSKGYIIYCRTYSYSWT